MADFGITPPTALFGMINATNELLVRFDLPFRRTRDTADDQRLARALAR